MPDPRPTVKLVPHEPALKVEPAAKSSRHQYSVRRAKTDNEHSQMVERVSVGRVATPVAAVSRPKWRVEMTAKTATLRSDYAAIELPIEDAVMIAEAILRGR